MVARYDAVETGGILISTAEVVYSPGVDKYLALATFLPDLDERGMDVRGWRLAPDGTVVHHLASNPYDVISSGLSDKPEGFCATGRANEAVIVGQESRQFIIGPPAVGFAANTPPP